MAQMFPPSPVPGTPHSERVLFDSLSRLDDTWRIFHSVVWQSQRGKRQGDGEADFVVMHRDFGLLILEVKGGSIKIENGRWFTANKEGTFEIKNPFEQAKTSKYALLRYLENLSPPIVNIPIAHAVSFPDCTVTTDIGTYGPRPLVLDRTDLIDCATAVRQVFSHWQHQAAITKSEMGSITSLLAPTLTIKPRLRGELAAVESRLIELTNQQVEALAHIRRLRRAVIYGGPGTGKTILAVERAQRLVQDGFKTLLVCFNAPLGDALARDTANVAGLTAVTFHSLCYSFAARAGIRPPGDPDELWWRDEAPEVLVVAAETLGEYFDAVVADEGQDFSPAWFTSLMMLLTDSDDGPFYVFADDNQALYQPGWQLQLEFPPFDLTINCRNSLPIARRVAAIFGSEVLAQGTEGPATAWLRCKGSDDALDTAQELVARLVDGESVDPSSIVVLSDRKDFVTQLRQRIAGDAVFVELGRSGVPTETIHRFKGLEGDVVVVVLLNLAPDLQVMQNAFVGFSRAKLVLYVIAPESLKPVVRW
jgi:Nuclease-related domain/AAA domain